MNSTNCTVCREVRKEGANLLGVHICEVCLSSIANVGMDDVKYEYYKCIIKKIWLDYITGMNKINPQIIT
ncbi:hypothetical protein CLPU_2c02840 [Gottschalkia purinilytica]|uniref:Inhibitor of sigma-G Gin n=1 Tax=Gottschalkia purinilytica TaxID=1503 RepID=A0A0L0WEC6_GOTPU|nr:sigma factor G inhibitor Gin [Gottschalkia purinilytica]KNF09832.1 hypothetical protein CLPU_2c02840 [Gottschalkia purinilytica]